MLVIFFLVGVVKTCGSFAEVKKPESVFKLFVRFALAKAVITHGLELMLAIFKIVQGVMQTIMQTAGLRWSNTNNFATRDDNCDRRMSDFLKAYHYGQLH